MQYTNQRKIPNAGKHLTIISADSNYNAPGISHQLWALRPDKSYSNRTDLREDLSR